MYMGIQTSSPSIISSKERSKLWIWFRCSPFFSSMAMPNIHFLGKKGSLAISVMGISLYMVTGRWDLDSMVALRKSNSLSIISANPK